MNKNLKLIIFSSFFAIVFIFILGFPIAYAQEGEFRQTIRERISQKIQD